VRFDQLLWQCLVPGRLDFDESGVYASFTLQDDETALMFRTDSASFQGTKVKSKACDLLYFYRGPAVPKPTLLFTELKHSGDALPKAQQQILSAIAIVSQDLHQSCLRAGKKRPAEMYAVAVVVLGGTAPTDAKRQAREFQKLHKIPLQVVVGTARSPADVRSALGVALEWP
jgi:hypothetical protein